MAKPFDATTKHLIETNPQDWLEYVGMPRSEVQTADGPNVTGELEYHWPDGTRYEQFLYTVIRAWEKPVERYCKVAWQLCLLRLSPG